MEAVEAASSVGEVAASMVAAEAAEVLGSGGPLRALPEDFLEEVMEEDPGVMEEVVSVAVAVAE